MKGEAHLKSQDPDLAGTVTFHLPTLYERIAIGKRMAQLCAPARWEDLPPDERALVRVIATLEYVIDTAPRGFYESAPDGPRLAPGRLLVRDEPLLWEVWAAYVALEERFRRGGEAPGGDGGLSGGSDGGPGGEGPGA
ncbi:hypothetical protein KZX47_12765 [Thermus sp. SYSU G05001]|uniref:Uncharacterized protein n=1 Tax=Thermus brevis TaxID=2862456 RepID=A0ABS7A137_9DEIN|nr:hypothetical protein [Thermus brevis]MBW6396016.1 hypothetical protein [Thermus brevis]